MLKKLSLILCTLMLVVVWNIHAQLAPNSVATNFALTDLDGQTHVLYDYLDLEKPVIINVFAVWSPASWFYTENVINPAYELYGPNGDNSITFLSIEADDATNDDLANNNSYGDWQGLIPYPIINQSGNFANDYAIANDGTSYPTIYIVYPNRLVTPLPIDLLTSDPDLVAEYADPANYNYLVPGGANNVGIVSYNGPDTYCQNLPVSYSVQNLGSQTLTSFEASLLNNGVVIGSENWSGSLNSYELAELDFGFYMFDDDVNLQLILTNPNGVGDELPEGNILNNTITTATNIGEANMQLELTTDLSPEEITWLILDTEGFIIYQNEALEAAESYSHTFTFENEGCYQFAIIDSGGDGLSTISSSISLSYNGVVLFDNPDFGESELILFEVEFPADPISVAIDNYDVDVDGVLTILGVSPDEIVSWEWDFGDGTTGTGQNATHAYTQSGTYTVTLTVMSADGQTATVNQQVMVDVSVAVSIATYNVDEGGVLSLQGASPNTIESWSWNFGDSNTGTGQSVTHAYASNGTYMVTLTATGTNGQSASVQQEVMVNITADFNAFFDYTINDLTITVADNSLNAESWSWDFGDGTAAVTEATPAPHTYANYGTYDVCLTITNGGDSDQHCETVTFENVGIEDMIALHTATLSPNPAQDYLNIQITSPTTNFVNWAISDVTGKTLVNNSNNQVINTGENTLTLPLEDLSNGLYILRLQVGKEIMNKQFLIVR